ncbi:hypothetical protein CVT26_004999 [Gymnopilus dilepis]|uniref:CBM1 domain-containing protein n=1 Tax=Gymnopilus dilepis TaxID=231916 RepID=A0A409Y044_9AGAR|nr:hypothetical protein CVT26_004999 [Gymnopilus dilepis]
MALLHLLSFSDLKVPLNLFRLKMKRASLITALIGILPYAAAQQTLWGQCGGINWTGPTTCASGQCLPGAASSTTSTKPTTTSNPLTSTTQTPTPTTIPSGTGKANYWFGFGDSYSQTQFNISGPLPNLSNPIGNPPFPGYSATGGANWVGYLTATYNNSLLFTYNYAYGGATINASLVAPYEPTVLSLGDQVNQFLTTVANKPPSTPWTSANSLFSVWIGVNDIGNSYYQSGNRSAFAETLLDNYFSLVQKLYNAGGRNFLFANVPPIDRSPLMLAQSTDAQALEKSVIADFNTRLLSRVQSFQSANSGVKTFFWDSNAQFTTMLNNPTAYGFADATSYGSAATDFWG